MCGIVGYVGRQKATPILLDGLKRLEYRGYDSAGVALHEADSDFKVFRETGRVESLLRKTSQEKLPATIGISHTRWATHGGVTEANAHPHASSDNKICLVHNGVIENYSKLRKFLIEKGFKFSSETDTEVLSNLIAYHYAEESETQNGTRFEAAIRHALAEVEGTYGIAVICVDCPGEIIGARKGSPLIIGVGKDEMFIASDVTAFAGRTQNVIYLDDGQIAHVSADDFRLENLKQEAVEAKISLVDWDLEDAELGSFPHFMLKEIYEQPKTVKNALRGRISEDSSTAQFGGLNISARELCQIDRILFIACGTAWHSCLIAEYMIEKYARIPVEVEYASEFRYRNAPLDKNTLVFVMSQSGETIDTLEALREARRKGYRTLGILNVVGSTMARENDGGIYQHCGPEIGVASTKAFTSQVVISTAIALYLGRMRDLSFAEGSKIVDALQSLPDLVSQCLAEAKKIEAIAKKYAKYEDFLFLGRQEMFPVALEGALKLKEISYIHAEGYPAAEMKHGPIALISEECPSVFIATQGEIFQKTISNIQEVKARKGPVIVITDDASNFPEDLADDIILIPSAHESVGPILASIPLQLLSYYIAVERGCDVDKPRNLAKSVTVE